jgi:transposase-like protein
LVGLVGKPRWTPKEARLVLAAQVESGESMAAFARRHGMGLARLYAWRQKVSGASDTGSAPRLLPVRVVSGPGVASSPALEIVLERGWRIRVFETVDPLILERVIDVLERSRC